MKIALLTNGLYPYTMGGMQKHSYYLARYLARKGVRVDIYYFKSKEKEQKPLEKYFSSGELENLAFFEIDFPSSIYFPGHYIFNSYRYSANIYHKLKTKLADTDFIYAQGFTGLKLLKEKESGKRVPPVGVNFHGLEMFQLTADIRSKLEQYLFRYPVKFSLQQADIAFSLGGKLTNIIKRQAGNGTTILETPIGIEEKWLNEKTNHTTDKRKFIFVGRYERRKGVQELNRAIKKINGKYQFDFEFIGPIPKKNRLKFPNCHYYGPIYDEDKIIDIITAGDVLVCPSYSEGMPTVILEAMSRGLAVIATDVGAVSELVSPQTGWLIEPASQSKLERALVQTIRIADAQLDQKKEAAVKLVEKKFTWNVVIDITLNQIQSYIKEKKYD